MIIKILLNKILIALVVFYRIIISPLFPPSCRFTPTCSEYAVTALKKYGPFKGVYLTVKRVLRCHPFNRGGSDPVP